jgi:hypothetical protein
MLHVSARIFDAVVFKDQAKPDRRENKKEPGSEPGSFITKV